MSFNIALSGLNAASADLNVTSNNIANSGTVGFKGSRAEFADVFASSQLGISQNAVGQGVRLSNVRQEFGQGQYDFTENSLDLAVEGTGFFRLDDGGDIVYSRAGAFEADRNGQIVNAEGKRLTGYQADADGNLTGALGPLTVDTGDVDPRATTELELIANLNGNAAAIDPGLVFDPTDPSSFNESTSTTVFDSLGNPQDATLYFRKEEGADDNTWQVFTEIGDAILPAPGGPEPVQVTFGNNGRFESLDGDGTEGSVFSGTFPIAGADDLNISLDLARLTQFGTPFSVAELRQDGFTAGQFSGLDVGADGNIFGRFTNGQARVLGQVALARFPNPERLSQIGDTAWAESFESGAPIVGEPGSSGLGGLRAGALEQSNVDITKELVNMITAQRNFQANAKMISTQDQVTQEILNIR